MNRLSQARHKFVNKVFTSQSSRAHKSPVVLLPPWVTCQEIRNFGKTSYDHVLRSCGIHVYAHSLSGALFQWADHEGRVFRSTVKSKLVVPYHVADLTLQQTGAAPLLIDPEPEWRGFILERFERNTSEDEDVALFSNRTSEGAPGAVPEETRSLRRAAVVSFIGGSGHGKTVLLDRLLGERRALLEPGGVTQSLFARTVLFDALRRQITPDVEFSSHKPLGARSRGSCRGGKRSNVESFRHSVDSEHFFRSVSSGFPRSLKKSPFSHVTFLDTPGSEMLAVLRGRLTAACDLVVVIVSSTSVPTVEVVKELLAHVDRTTIPLAFAFTKSDLPDSNSVLARYTKNFECYMMKFTVLYGKISEEAKTLRNVNELNASGNLQRDYSTALEANSVILSANTGGGIGNFIRVIDDCLATSYNPEGFVVPTPLLPNMTPGRSKETLGVLQRSSVLQGCHEQPTAVGTVLDVIRTEAGLRCIVNVNFGVVGTSQWFLSGTAWGKVHTFESSLPHSSYSGYSGFVLEIVPTSLTGDIVPDDLMLFMSEKRVKAVAEHRQRLDSLISAQVDGPSFPVPWVADAPDTNPRHQLSDAYAVKNTQYFLDVVPISARRKQELPISSEERVLTTFAELPDETLRGMDSDSTLLVPPLELADNTASDGKTAWSSTEREQHIRQAHGSLVDYNAAPAPEAKSSDTLHFLSFSDVKSTAEQQRQRVEEKLEKRLHATVSELLSDEEMAKEACLAVAMGRNNQQRFSVDSIQNGTPRTPLSGAKNTLSCYDFYSEDQSDEEEKAEAELVPLARLPIILRTETASLFDAVLNGLETVQAETAVIIPVVHGGLGVVGVSDVQHCILENNRKDHVVSGARGRCCIWCLNSGVVVDAARRAVEERVEMRRYNVLEDLVDAIRSEAETLATFKLPRRVLSTIA